MNKEDLLKKIREENEYYDPYEEEIYSLASRVCTIVTIVLSLVLYFLERIFWGRYNVGVFMIVTTILAVKETIVAIKFKTVSSIVYSAICVALFCIMLIAYIISFLNGWL